MDIVHSRRSKISWLVDGPIGPYVDAFKQHLTDRGYAAQTFAGYIGGIAHFAQWVHRQRLRLRRIDEAAIVEFLDDHLPQCRCAGPMRHDRGDLSAALGHLLVVLRARGAIAPSAKSTTPVDDQLHRYDEHMDHVRGLAPKTREMALRTVRRLLTARFADGRVDIPAIKPEHIRRFFAQQAKLFSKPANAGSVVAALRGRTKSEIARQALPRQVAVARFRELRRKTLPFAEAQGFVTDEDVFSVVA